MIDGLGRLSGDDERTHTERFLSSLIALISILRRPMVVTIQGIEKVTERVGYFGRRSLMKETLIEYHAGAWGAGLQDCRGWLDRGRVRLIEQARNR